MPKEKLGGFLQAVWEKPKAVFGGETGYLYSALGKINRGGGGYELVPANMIDSKTGLLKGVTKVATIQSNSVKVPTENILNNFKFQQITFQILFQFPAC